MFARRPPGLPICVAAAPHAPFSAILQDLKK